MMIFNRYLGHKPDIPGSGQWRMISSDRDQKQRCWMHNLDVYTLIFWTRQFGQMTYGQLIEKGFDEVDFENQIYEIQKRNKEGGYVSDMFAEGKHGPQLHFKTQKYAGFPLAYGDWNNWRPQRMFSLEEFCHLMDPGRFDVLAQLKKQKLVRKHCRGE